MLLCFSTFLFVASPDMSLAMTDHVIRQMLNASTDSVTSTSILLTALLKPFADGLCHVSPSVPLVGTLFCKSMVSWTIVFGLASTALAATTILIFGGLAYSDKPISSARIIGLATGGILLLSTQLHAILNGYLLSGKQPDPAYYRYCTSLVYQGTVFVPETCDLSASIYLRLSIFTLAIAFATWSLAGSLRIYRYLSSPAV